MKIPTDKVLRLAFYRDLVDACLASQQDRRDRYAEFRYYWLHGASPGQQASPWNRIYPHIELVTSFLYAQDSTRFSIEFGDSVPDVNFSFAAPFQKRLNNKWRDAGADDVFQQALIKALVFDSAFIKMIRRNGSVFPYVVEPGQFGVLREDQMMLDRQEAFAHTYQITLTELSARLEDHPRRTELIAKAQSQVTRRGSDEALPASTPKIILSAFSPNMIGRVSDVTGASTDVPSYSAKMNVDMADMTELWVWNDETEDYQTVTLIGNDAVVYDRQNIFLPRRKDVSPEHGFVQICPTPMDDYFWGIAEVSRLKELQDNRNSIMDRIENLRNKQVDPTMSYSGQGNPEEKMFGQRMAATMISIGMGEKIDTHPPMVPQDIYQDVHENDQAFMEASGISNIMSGRGDSGVRSKGQTTELARLGSARIKSRGLRIETALEKAAHLFAKCMVADDDDPMTATVHGKPVELIPAQMSDDFTVKVDAHSNSPIFVESMKEDAVGLFKAGVITPARFIQLMNPPMKEEILRELKEEIIPAKEKAAAEQQALEQQKAAGKGGGDGGPQLKAVG